MGTSNYTDNAVVTDEARRVHALGESMRISGVGFGPTSVDELLTNAAQIERYLKEGLGSE